ncbi:MAG: FecR family protein [Bacteroidales bacterium]|nr:FecR family protein [Bacteroidales bacterium]
MNKIIPKLQQMTNKGLLHKFFKGITTTQEEVEIRKWIEENKRNEALFYQERLLYDTILLNKATQENKTNEVKPKSKVFFYSFMRAAAILLFIITTGLLINKYYNDKNSSPQLHTVNVPPGQRINLVLADNTSIWLNSNTTFKYPSQFSRKQREVYLDGEAYFDVSADEKHPFIVNTSQGGVKVTGTTFNVSAYSKYDKFETSLFEGSVSICLNNYEDKIISIQPTQKAVARNGMLEVTSIEDYDEFLWRRGLIAFNNKQLEQILAVFEQYFDTEIRIETDCLPDNTYTGKFRQSDGIDYALRVLQRSINFTYERDNEEQIIHIKNT